MASLVYSLSQDREMDYVTGHAIVRRKSEEVFSEFNAWDWLTTQQLYSELEVEDLSIE